ncbi:cytochrome c oxidase subunit 2 [Rhizopus azygosporus]|uniref:cytochrome-c oxidase n=1 Tax=Rhizopus azygosporus TaxID=86630 RepID=A0A367JI76_RHIAZ|nr:cytochrome c oxidase subunit 2 [Rhizopus azygosporus]
MTFSLWSTFVQCDAAEPWQIGFQDGASPTFEGSIVFNYSSTSNPISHKYSNHGTLIELRIKDVISPAMTIKAVGHQWYWSYEYSDFVNEDGESIEFDSYMIPDSDLEDGQLRLLDVDNRVVLPVDTHVRFVVTGADVIHDFAVPSLGLKIDATPGRLNQVSVITEREGVYYGQCSELCGVYHGFMPIAVEAVSLDKYLSWLDSQS